MNFETFWSKIGSPWGYLLELLMISNFLALVVGLLIKYNHFYFDSTGWKGFIFYLGNLIFILFVGLFISSSVQLGISLLKKEVAKTK